MSLIISLFLLDFRRVYCAVMKGISALMFLFTNEMVLVIELLTFFSCNRFSCVHSNITENLCCSV